MSDMPMFDPQAAHRHFSTECFNKAWDLIDKPDRTPTDNEEMLRLGMTSLWHWMQRQDCTPTTLSAGYWQVSRINALLGRAADARRYGELCLEISQQEGVEPFYLAYAYEALARAALVAGERSEMQLHLTSARQTAEQVTDIEAKAMLLTDLDVIP